MEFKKLGEVLSNEPGYRLKQIKQALFVDLIDTWEQVTNLPKSLIVSLLEEFPLDIKAETFNSQDGQTVKTLITFDDGTQVETVLMKHGDDRNTICVSSQVGCPMGCAFCATGQLGLKRNLTDWEIVTQVLFFARLLKKTNERVSGVVFMGMGEPFLNYENVLGAIRILNDKDGLNIGARHLSISTSGVLEGISKLAEENLQVNLAISLHAPTDDLRSRLMPINNKHKISELMRAIDLYIKKTGRRVMFEYLMLEEVNDSLGQATKLAELVRGKLAFVNLISYNDTGLFKSSKSAQIKLFKEELEKRGVEVVQRYKFGRDIEGACGQLAGRK